MTFACLSHGMLCVHNLVQSGHTRVCPESASVVFFLAAVCSRDYAPADQGEAAQEHRVGKKSAGPLLEDNGTRQ